MFSKQRHEAVKSQHSFTVSRIQDFTGVRRLFAEFLCTALTLKVYLGETLYVLLRIPKAAD